MNHEQEAVAYFSVSGVTVKAAQEIANMESADCFEIRPEVPYTKNDLDWTNKQSRSTLEMRDLDCRPVTAGCVENMAQYDAVFVGYPIVQPASTNLDSISDSCPMISPKWFSIYLSLISRLNNDFDGFIAHLHEDGFLQLLHGERMGDDFFQLNSSLIDQCYGSAMGIRIDHGTDDL